MAARLVAPALPALQTVVALCQLLQAVPKTIMQLMNVEGLTRENVASHLQKYRILLRKKQEQEAVGAAGTSPTAAHQQHERAGGGVPGDELAEGEVHEDGDEEQQHDDDDEEDGGHAPSPSRRNRP